MKKKKKIGCISIIVLVVLFNPISLIFFAVSCAMWSNEHPKIGKNIKSVDWLPKEAHNISYYKTYSYTAFEFDISEEGFKKWAADYDCKKIETPEKVCRYNRMTLKMPRFDSNVINDDAIKEFEKYQSTVNATIVNGYYYRKEYSNGGRTHVVYDLDKGRAYSQFNPR